jgi:biopolymer transport protein ExbB/TolQ
MIFYAIFRGRAQRLISDLEAATSQIVAILSLQQTRRRERAPALLEDEF